MLNTFVIKDRSRHSVVGYYVLCMTSCVSNGLICHLEPIGWYKDLARMCVPHHGDSNLGTWARRVHGAETFLFD